MRQGVDGEEAAGGGCFGLQDTDGNLGETGHARSAPAPFAGDDLIVPGGKPAHKDRLDQSVLGVPSGWKQE